MRKTITIIIISILLLHAQLHAQNETHKVANPTIVGELPETLKETSGLAFVNGKLFTHNDSGNKPAIYVIDTATLQITQTITISNVKNHDWEDICSDGKNLFIGDIGNNHGNRTNLCIYILPLSTIPQEGDTSVNVEKIKFHFDDQTDFEKKKVHDFDCEAMFATDKYIYLFSKGWLSGTTRMYRLTKEPGKHTAEKISWFNSKGLVTGADYDKKNKRIILIGYVNKIWEPFVYIINNFDEDMVTAQNGIRISIPNHLGSQTEGICFYNENQCFISAEKNKINNNAMLMKINIKRMIKSHKRQRE